jgi:hypothetical protein
MPLPLGILDPDCNPCKVLLPEKSNRKEKARGRSKTKQNTFGESGDDESDFSIKNQELWEAITLRENLSGKKN